MKCGLSFLTMTTFVALVSFAATAQNAQDCREKKDVPFIKGHWKDDQTGYEVDIESRDRLHNTVAIYSKTHNCPHPDKDGKAVPLQTDFEGVTTGLAFVGIINVCRWRDEGGVNSEGNPRHTYTYTVDHVDLKLWMSEDGMGLRGFWRNPDTNKDEDITLTRLDKPDFPTAQFTRVTTAPGAKIYAQPDTTSEVRDTPAPGTTLEILSAEKDDNGNVAWYQVDDPSRSTGSHYYGWIRLGEVKCNKPAPKKLS